MFGIEGRGSWLLVALLGAAQVMGCSKAEAPADRSAGQAPTAAPLQPTTLEAPGRGDGRREGENKDAPEAARKQQAGVKADAYKGGAPRAGACIPGDPLCDLGTAPAPAAKLPGEMAGSGGLVQGAKPVSPPPMTATASAAMVPAMPVDVRPQGEVAIDPNGRFATTYRPGGGHLLAFESAVSRGIVPAAERELVSDVGARYAADFAVPKGKTMMVQTDLERGKQAPSGGQFHARLTLKSTAQQPSERPHLSVHLVLDVSGSMQGEAINNARKAAQALVDKLGPGDDFSLVTFSSEAEVKIADGPVGPRRDSIKKTIEGIQAIGGTNIGAGLMMGYAEASKPSIPKDAVKVVMLLSDGHVNAGILDKGKLAKLALDAFQQGVQTSTFGLGGDFDGPLMSQIGSEGAGGYYYLRDSEQIAPALTTEIDKRLDPVATAVEVRVRLKKGVELLQVYGSRRLSAAEAATVRKQEVAADQQAQTRDGIKVDRQDDQEGGMRFFIPAFARDDSHAILLKLKVSEGAGSRPLALVELKYKDRVTKKNVSEEFPVAYEYAASDAESAASLSASVQKTVQGFAAGETLLAAGQMIERGDRQRAAALLAEREGILRQAAETLKEPLFLKDADRLARLREHTGVQTGVGDPLVLAMLLETASRVHLH